MKLKIGFVLLATSILIAGCMNIKNNQTKEMTPEQLTVQTIEQANGRSVVLKQEKIGDGRQPMIVTHYGRLAETGEVTYWTEVHYEMIRFNREGERVR